MGSSLGSRGEIAGRSHLALVRLRSGRPCDGSEAPSWARMASAVAAGRASAVCREVGSRSCE